MSGPRNLAETAETPPPDLPTIAVRRVVVTYSPTPSEIGAMRILADVPVHMGRSGDAPALVFQDSEVSREHARIVGEAGGFAVEDLGSRNGTFVRGERIARAVLRDGDSIRVGAISLVYEEIGPELLPSLGTRSSAESSLLGDSPALRRLVSRLRRIAPSDEPVMILGETGSGKELVAQQIHAWSGRSGAFVPVNCAALPESLAENELFGNVRGAFTGAAGSEGLFGAAENGTIFLDEIGDAPPSTQSKLLRVLATGELRSVGETHARRGRFRVVAATNVDVERGAQSGEFRADLLARLSAHVVRVPPLRARKSDILPLACTFLSALREQSVPDASAIAATFSPDAAEALVAWNWPLNVRELEQAMRGARLATDAQRPIGLGDLPDRVRGSLSRLSAAPVTGPTPSVAALLIRRDLVPDGDQLLALLQHYAGNVSRVAEFFGKDRKQIYRWAERHGILIDKPRS